MLVFQWLGLLSAGIVCWCYKGLGKLSAMMVLGNLPAAQAGLVFCLFIYLFLDICQLLDGFWAYLSNDCFSLMSARLVCRCVRGVWGIH